LASRSSGPRAGRGKGDDVVFDVFDFDDPLLLHGCSPRVDAVELAASRG
jgi:hypothetical protein